MMNIKWDTDSCLTRLVNIYITYHQPIPPYVTDIGVYMTGSVRPDQIAAGFISYGSIYNCIPMKYLDLTIYYNPSREEWREIFKIACRMGWINIIRYVIKWKTDGFTDWKIALQEAARGGHLKLVKYFNSKLRYDSPNQRNINTAMSQAIVFNRVEVAKWLASTGDYNINMAYAYALRVGNTELAAYFEPFCG
jgi:hypothetical protein